ncbi:MULTISPECIES: TrkH family potassium uptake protein [Rufibacter]|uniref:Potassium uptake TrkH family protein n=1 Tax=Rufibacter quisquiliarum TaxID=1549639 RepID=A0A839GA97_9BACT|nr:MULTISPECIES: potassium transporter TrkG [Rufibacter]MBA9076444.1 potassium uptake TrkH family protein [Rufibacter quisquiliarum]
MKNKQDRIKHSPTLAILGQSPRIVSFLDSFLLYFSSFGLLLFLYDIGFEKEESSSTLLHYFYHAFFLTVLGSLGVRTYLMRKELSRRPSLIFEGLLLSFMAVAVIARFILKNQITSASTLLRFFDSEQVIYFVIFYVFLVEISKKTLLFYRPSFHPAQLFILSFVFLVAVGTGLLLLPQATYEGISFIDAVFTATSAVCVTGLITLDTATVFTPTGKVMILILIQVGGLGIMTFASFFGIFFKGSSLQSSLFMRDWLNEDNLSQITRTLFKIVTITLGIELLGAGLIYLCLEPLSSELMPDRISFSLFHAVSAFCNAGFSTLSMGLYDPMIRFNYPLQLVIAFLVIMGGLGFPIVFNLYRFVRQLFLRLYNRFRNQRTVKHTPRVLNVNTLLVTITTLVLLVVGMVLYFLLEYNNTLAEHTLAGKIVGAFFGSVTPRTAGFNTVDMAALTAPTVLLYLLLMWIGASPASVGGGIKTTTFAVAILNIISLARGKDRVEVFRREIEQESVYKAFAIILLSLLVIGLSVFLVTLFDPQLGLAAVAFECFSGFSTVGLSVGITSLLSTPSKVVLIVTMFLGRVGTLTLIIGLLRKVSTLRYRYPTETIIIT